VKLLRVLQEHEFERVGDTRTINVDCRIVAATNRDLVDLVEREEFREDLYYRLNVLPIYIPPLRERTDDIPLLVEHFLKRYSEENQRRVTSVDNDAMGYLKAYPWPGNVRELQNYIERAIVLADGNVISSSLLPSHVRGEAPPRLGRVNRTDLESMCAELVSRGLGENPDDGAAYNAVMGMVEKELISQVLRICQGTQTKTALRLGINRNTLHKKIDEHSLQALSR
jgi:DNA-binding NtrC family response regulator